MGGQLLLISRLCLHDFSGPTDTVIGICFGDLVSYCLLKEVSHSRIVKDRVSMTDFLH